MGWRIRVLKSDRSSKQLTLDLSPPVCVMNHGTRNDLVDRKEGQFCQCCTWYMRGTASGRVHCGGVALTPDFKTRIRQPIVKRTVYRPTTYHLQPPGGDFARVLLQSHAGTDLPSAGPCSEKMRGPSPGAADPIFPGEKLATFFWSSLSLLFISLVHTGVAHYFRPCKKLPLLLWGLLYVGPLFGGTC